MEEVRNLIQYIGIDNQIPQSTTIFKQFNVQRNCCLPIAKPDIEQIVKCFSELVIKHTSVIKTPKGTSLEGQILTGRKLVVEGVVKQKIQYVADEPEQSVHGTHCDIPFSIYVILPENFVDGSHVKVRGFIEDVYVQKSSENCIFNNITIILTGTLG